MPFSFEHILLHILLKMLGLLQLLWQSILYCANRILFRFYYWLWNISCESLNIFDLQPKVTISWISSPVCIAVVSWSALSYISVDIDWLNDVFHVYKGYSFQYLLIYSTIHCQVCFEDRDDFSSQLILLVFFFGFPKITIT